MGSKTKIEWCDYTINPIIGCKHGCKYCYGKRMNDRFHFVKRWDKPEGNINWTFKIRAIKKPSIIFMGSMTDLFGNWVEDYNINIMLDFCGHFPQHKFLFLTKNPKRYAEFKFPKNCWRGATVDNSDAYTPAYAGDCDFLSIEPFDPKKFNRYFDYDTLRWVIIGGMTPHNLHKKKDIDELLDFYAERPIFLKNNLHYPKVIQEFPEELKGGGRCGK